MTIANTQSKVSYNGNGSQTVFDITFTVLDAAHVRVARVLSSGVIVPLTAGSHFTVDIATLKVTTLAGSTIQLGEQIVISRQIPLTQETDYPTNDPFPSASHEAALDKLTLISQQLDEAIKRSVKQPISGNLDVVLPPPQANQLIGWNSTADGLINAPDAASYVVAAQNSANAAASSASLALQAIDQLKGTSASSVTIGTGSKVFVTQSGKLFTVGTWVNIVHTTPSNFMFGQVTAYTDTTLTVNVTAISGSGTHNTWTIQVSGLQGPTGAQGPAGSVTDGDKGDVVVSASGAVWTVDSNAITNAKLADMAGNTVKVNATAVSADPTDLSLAPSQLLGRGSSGNMSAISLGSGLSMSGDVLNATGTVTKTLLFSSIAPTANANGSLSYTGDLGSVYAIATCTSSEAGYSNGAKLVIPCGAIFIYSGGNPQATIAVYKDVGNVVRYRVGAGGVLYLSTSGTSFTLTGSSWLIDIYNIV